MSDEDPVTRPSDVIDTPGSGRTDGSPSGDATGGESAGAGERPPPAREYGESGVDPYADADPVLELSGVARAYGSETAVESVDLTVREGELVTLLGPSGCGKTTTLRLIAGLETPTAGRVVVDGEPVADATGRTRTADDTDATSTDDDAGGVTERTGTVDDTGGADATGGDAWATPPEERDVGLVFQEYALFPHMTVAENVAFGIDDWPADRRDERVRELLELVGLGEYGDRAPADLSGGQRQRVALARSLAPEPDVLLLDEPFSNLDVRLRQRMREEVRRILKAAGVTAVSVTHDQEEALSISDRVAVMADGRLEQVGRPETVFEHPESRFVAEFIGQAGFLTGRLSGGSVETGIGTLPADRLQGLTDEYTGARVDVLVRPDDLRATPVDPEERAGNGTIRGREYTGPSFVYEVELDTGDRVLCEHNHATEFGLDRRVAVDLVADHTLAWYPAE